MWLFILLYTASVTDAFDPQGDERKDRCDLIP